jgi:hypothetical protein
MFLLIFVAAETGVCVPLPSKLTSTSAAIPAFKPCLPSRCLAMNYSITIYFDSQLKQLFPFLVFYSTFVVMYPNYQSYMPKDRVNIEKHIKTYLLNKCVFNVIPGNQSFPMTFFSIFSWLMTVIILSYIISVGILNRGLLNTLTNHRGCIYPSEC